MLTGAGLVMACDAIAQGRENDGYNAARGASFAAFAIDHRASMAIETIGTTALSVSNHCRSLPWSVYLYGAMPSATAIAIWRFTYRGHSNPKWSDI